MQAAPRGVTISEVAEPGRQLDVVRELLREYLHAEASRVRAPDYQAELTSLPGAYAPPAGVSIKLVIQINSKMNTPGMVKNLLAATLCGAVVFTPHAFAQSKGGGKIVGGGLDLMGSMVKGTSDIIAPTPAPTK